ncbi:DUF6270 domain-containing protein [Mesobacillus jeotgali]|uniref:DUF6270 domain-containing protein n=1 Tax=Mesobacillus jeotgali TaxID=129985 RepID=UPI0009A89A80|nr:DUF6270 domain-containing protein [Mesobacillus jeotgali]
MDTKKNVSVLGSCATRDNFNSKFNENYKEFYECILTQNQTSIISLMSEKIGFSEEDLGDLEEYTKWNVRTDFNKEFLLLLKEKAPDYLIMDFFADIHFGCIQLEGNKFITNNRWMVWKTEYYKRLKATEDILTLNIQDHTEKYIELWKCSLDKLANFLKEELPDCKVIIHKARNVRKILTEDCAEFIDLSTSGKVKKENVEVLNSLWDQLDNYAINAHNWNFIELPESTTFEGHPWGPFYVHYTMDYYHQFLNQLHGIVIQDIVNDSDNELLRDIVHDWAKRNNENLLLDKNITLTLERLIFEEKRKNHKLKLEIEKLKKECNLNYQFKKTFKKVPFVTKFYRVINKGIK